VISLNDFGERLKILRTSKGLTQEQLARRLNLTKSVVSAYELGMRMPSVNIVIKMSAIFAVTTDYLLGVDEKQRFDLSGLSEGEVSLVRNLINTLKDKKTM